MSMESQSSSKIKYFLYKQTNGRYFEIYACEKSSYDWWYFERGAKEIEISKEVFCFLRDALDKKPIAAKSFKSGLDTTYFVYKPI